MNCPHCGEYVPENNYRCPNCKKAVQEAVDPAQFRAQQVNKQRSSSTTTSFIMIVVVIGVALLAYLMFFKSDAKEEVAPTPGPAATTSRPAQSTPPETAAVRPPETAEDAVDDGFNAGEAAFAGALKTGTVLNQGNPGGEVQIEEHVQGDQVTIFNFHSPFSPLCMKYTPWLAQLDNKRDDIVVFRIDVNRPGISGIDKNSPVARQFGLQRLPYFVIYSAEGVRTHEGQDARNRIEQWIKKEGIAK